MVRLLFVVVLLASFSGISEFFERECPPVETSQNHTNCEPTCVRCGCCHQAFDVGMLHPLSAVGTVPLVAAVFFVQKPRQTSRDIFHVPKLASA